jgi:hypothetical protein
LRSPFNSCYKGDGSVKETKTNELKELAENENYWGDYEEELLIEEYIKSRDKTINGTRMMNDAIIRSDKIKEASLSKTRNSFA